MDSESQSSSANLQKLAINAALNCKWQEALDINSQLSELEPTNIECLNRIAKAYFELGQYSQAKKTYQLVLDIDPYNTIAQKNLKKVNAIKANKSAVPSGLTTLSPSLFLEEPGITTVVNLVKVAEPQKLLMLSPGMTITLMVKKKGITVADLSNNYIGALPDDVAHHMTKLIDGGNKYLVIIKNVKSNGLTVLIREVFRSKKFKNQASFLGEAKILAYSSDNISLLKDSDESSSDDQDSSEDIVI